MREGQPLEAGPPPVALVSAGTGRCSMLVSSGGQRVGSRRGQAHGGTAGCARLAGAAHRGRPMPRQHAGGRAGPGQAPPPGGAATRRRRSPPLTRRARLATRRRSGRRGPSSGPSCPSRPAPGRPPALPPGREWQLQARGDGLRGGLGHWAAGRGPGDRGMLGKAMQAPCFGGASLRAAACGAPAAPPGHARRPAPARASSAATTGRQASPAARAGRMGTAAWPPALAQARLQPAPDAPAAAPLPLQSPRCLPEQPCSRLARRLSRRAGWSPRSWRSRWPR